VVFEIVRSAIDSFGGLVCVFAVHLYNTIFVSQQKEQSSKAFSGSLSSCSELQPYIYLSLFELSHMGRVETHPIR
jgi:hypothetical protein